MTDLHSWLDFSPATLLWTSLVIWITRLLTLLTSLAMTFSCHWTQSCFALVLPSLFTGEATATTSLAVTLGSWLTFPYGEKGAAHHRCSLHRINPACILVFKRKAVNMNTSILKGTRTTQCHSELCLSLNVVRWWWHRKAKGLMSDQQKLWHPNTFCCSGDKIKMHN